MSLRRSPAGVDLTVVDTVQGIAAEHLPHVFERFYRADSPATAHTAAPAPDWRSSAAVVTAHGRRVSAASAGPGTGTTFTVTLPPAPAPER